MYEPSRIMSTFHIAGFQYHDGALVLDKLKPGKKLKMVGEPDNPYDPNAIELRY
ncbi:MAG: HIRAN domain-containing protein, partial [Eggerthellaceae bacterium]|nr:HIRAN domain-containing protein [Eggerthellaceae bacterium]MBQ9043203.1 HIRAN domain-containing protein [Eggerthellaceae bacterium]